MTTTNRNACKEAFEALCNELQESERTNINESQYWLFERGYRAAVQELMNIAESGTQPVKFVSPKLQGLAERLISATDCV